MADNERIIELSINEREFKQQIDSITNYMSIFEKKINNFENKINKINLSSKFSNIDKNMSESSRNINKNMSNINNNLNNISNSIDNSVIKSLDSLNDRFSFLGITGLKVVNDLSDSFLNFSKNIIMSMTELRNMQSAMTKFEQKNVAIRTIMNSITDDKVPKKYASTIDYVTDALSKLETFSDETSYDFTEMTQSIGKFVSMGNSLKTAADTVLGMANWSSLVGKSAKDFNNLSYAIEKVAGLGYLGLREFQMTSTYFDPQTKKNILEQAAALGTLQKISKDTYRTLEGHDVSLATFSTYLKDRWLTMDVLNGVMSKYSEFSNAVIEYMDQTGASASEAIKQLEKQYDSVSVKAFKSAQEAKTFGEAIESVQVAVTTGWAKSFEYIFGNVEEASKNFTELANQLYDIFAIGKYTRNALLKSWSENGGRDTLISAFLGDEKEVNGIKERYGGLLSYISDIVNTIKSSINDTFGFLQDDASSEEIEKFSNLLLELTNNFKKFVDSIKPTEDFLNKLYNIVKSLSIIFKTSFSIILSVLKIGINIIKEFSSVLLEIYNIIATEIQIAFKYFKNTLDDLIKTIKNKLNPIMNLVKTFFSNISKSLITFTKSISELFPIIKNLIIRITNYIKKVDLSPIYNIFNKITTNIAKCVEYIIYQFNKIISDGNIEKLIDTFVLLFNKISSIFIDLFNTIKYSKLGQSFELLFNRILSIFNSFRIEVNKFDLSNFISNLLDNIQMLINKIPSFPEIKMSLEEYLNKLIGPSNKLSSFINNISSSLNNIAIYFKNNGIIETIKYIFNNIVNTIKNIDYSKLFSNLSTILLEGLLILVDIIKIVIDKIYNIINKIINGEISNKNSELLNNLSIKLGELFTKIKDTFLNIFKGISKVFSNTSLNILKLIPMVLILVYFIKQYNKVLDVANTFAQAKLKEEEFKNKLGIALIIVSIAGSLLVISKIPIGGIVKAGLTIAAIIAIVSLIPKLINKFLPISSSINTITNTSSMLGLAMFAFILNSFINQISNLANLVKTNPAGTIITMIFIFGLINRLCSAIESIQVNDDHLTIIKNIATFFGDFAKSLVILSSFIAVMNFGSIMKGLGALAASLTVIGIVIGVINALMLKIQSLLHVENQAKKDKSGGIIGSLFGTMNNAALTKSILALSALSIALKSLTEIPFGNLLVASIALGAMLSLLYYTSDKIVPVGDAVLKIAASIFIVSFAISSFTPKLSTLLGLLVMVVVPILAVVGALALLQSIGLGGALVPALQAISNIILFMSFTFLSASTAALILSKAIGDTVNYLLKIEKVSWMSVLKLIALAGAFGLVSIAIVPLVAALTPLIAYLATLVVTLATLAGKKITSFFDKDKVVDNAKDTAESANKTLKDKLYTGMTGNLKSKSKDVGKESGKEFFDGFSSKISGIKNIIFKDEKSIKNDASKSGEESGKGFFDRFLKKSGGLKTGFEDILKNVQDIFKESGKFSFEGFMEGFKKDDIKDATEDSIINPFKDITEINSPSKLFFRFGEYSMQGYIDGVNSKKKDFYKSLNEIKDREEEIMAKSEYVKQLRESGIDENYQKFITDYNKLAEESSKEESSKEDPNVSYFVKEYYNKINNINDNDKMKVINSLHSMSNAFNDTLISMGKYNAEFQKYYEDIPDFDVKTKESKLNEFNSKMKEYNKQLSYLQINTNNILESDTGISNKIANIKILEENYKQLNEEIKKNNNIPTKQYFVQYEDPFGKGRQSFKMDAIDAYVTKIKEYSAAGLFSLSENFFISDEMLAKIDEQTFKYTENIRSFIDAIQTNDIDVLKQLGFSDEEILRAVSNQEILKESILNAASGYDKYDEKIRGISDSIRNNQLIVGEMQTFFNGLDEQQMRLAQGQIGIMNVYSSNAEFMKHEIDTLIAKSKDEEEYEKLKSEALKQVWADRLKSIGDFFKDLGAKVIDSFKMIGTSIKNLANKFLDLLPKPVKDGIYNTFNFLKGVPEQVALGFENLGISIKKWWNDLTGQTEAETLALEKMAEAEEEATDKMEELNNALDPNRQYDSEYLALWSDKGAEAADEWLRGLMNELDSVELQKELYVKVKGETVTDEELLEFLNNKGKKSDNPDNPEDNDNKTGGSKKEKVDPIKEHRKFLQNYKEQLDEESKIIKYFSNDRKNLFKKQLEDQNQHYEETQELNDFFNVSAQNDVTTWLDTLATGYEASDELFKGHLEELDENMSAEDKLYARRLEALKKFYEEEKIVDSGMNWGSVKVSEGFKQETSKIKKHEAISNMRSYLMAYQNFQKDIEYLAGTNISQALLSAAYKDGPNGELFLAIKGMADNQLEAFDKVWSEVNGYQTNGDSAWFAALTARRSQLQEQHRTINLEMGSSSEKPFILGKQSSKKTDRDKEELKTQLDEAQYEIEKEIEKNKSEIQFTPPVLVDPNVTTNAEQTGYNIVTGMATGMQAALPTLQNTAAQVSAMVNTQTVDPNTAVQNVATNNLSNLEVKISELKTILDAVLNITFTLSNGITQLLNTSFTGNDGLFEQGGQNIDASIAKGITDNTNVVITAVNNMLNAAINEANSLLGIASPSKKFFEIGEYITKGLANGIESGRSTVVSAMVDKVLASMSDEAEYEEEINSPSKKWMRFGEFIDEGLKNGILENSNSPLNALRDMLNNISEDMEYDEEYNPVITPVIDLDTARKQAQGISTLFASDQALNVSTEMQSLRANQNGGKFGSSSGNSYTFTQNNYSPKELSRSEIYRQTNNQFSQIKTLLEK